MNPIRNIHNALAKKTSPRSAQSQWREEADDASLAVCLSEWDEPETDPDFSPLCGLLAGLARSGDAQAVRLLLEANPGLDLDGNGPDYEMPLHFACLGGSVECVQALLDSGASPGMSDRNGSTPLRAAIGGVKNTSGAICRLLASRGAPFDQRDMSGMTPFLRACRICDLDAAQALAALGADMWTISHDKKDAFDHAQAMSWSHGRTSQTAMLDWLGAMAERDELDGGDEAAEAPSKRSRRI